VIPKIEEKQTNRQKKDKKVEKGRYEKRRGNEQPETRT
jgi:hypothetical protein